MLTYSAKETITCLFIAWLLMFQRTTSTKKVKNCVYNSTALTLSGIRSFALCSRLIRCPSLFISIAFGQGYSAIQRTYTHSFGTQFSHVILLAIFVLTLCRCRYCFYFSSSFVPFFVCILIHTINI